MRVQGPPHVDFLPALRAAADHLEVPGDGPALLVVHGARLLVAHPGVRASPARVHPHDVLEAKVLAQRHVHDLDGHGDELPAPAADVGLVAARADVVVVRQIDIEAQLLGQRLKGARVPQRLAVPRVRRVHRSDLETGWELSEDVLTKPIEKRKHVVSYEIFRRDGRMSGLNHSQVGTGEGLVS